MSDSQRLHESFLGCLQAQLADEDFRNLDTLAWALTGLLLQKTTRVPAWSVACLIKSTPPAANSVFAAGSVPRWLTPNATIAPL